MVERLMSWDHNSGFSVHAGKPINGVDREAIERQARYMSRTPLSVERIHYHADDHSVTVDGGKSHAGLKKWTVPEYSLNVRKVFSYYGHRMWSGNKSRSRAWDYGPGLYFVGRDPGLPGRCGCYPGFALFSSRQSAGRFGHC